MRRRLGNNRLEKLLIYSLVNFSDDVRAAALARLPVEAQHIREAVDAQLAEDDDEEALAAADASGPSAEAVSRGSADAAAEEDEDSGTDV